MGERGQREQDAPKFIFVRIPHRRGRTALPEEESPVREYLLMGAAGLVGVALLVITIMVLL